MKRFYAAFAAASLVVVTLFGGTIAANATSYPPEECIPNQGSEAYDETIVDVAAHWQRYSWTGGKSYEGDPAPAFPGEDWQANVEGDPHGIGVAGAYFVSHGSSGKVDWFYLEWVPEVTHVVHHDAVPPVICEPEPILTWIGLPVVKDLCETANDHYGLPEVGPGVTVIRDGLGFVATLETGYSWDGAQEGWVEEEGNLFFAFNPEDFTNENCEQEVPIPALFSAEPTPPTCEVDGSFDFNGEFPNVTITVTPEYDGPGEYLIEATANEGYEFTDGTTYKSLEVVVLGKIATQSENPEAPCYLAPPEEPEEPVTPVTPQDLAFTGGDPSGPLTLGGILLSFGLVAALAGYGNRRGWFTS